MSPLDHVRIGMVGSGFMGTTHSLAYQSATMLHGDALPTVERLRVADVVAEVAERASKRFGWAEATTDWRRITRADDIDLVDVVTPNYAHAEIAIDAARHGKHVFCEKPLAVDVEEARAMYRAVRDAGVTSQVGFVYRRWPAMQLAKALIEEGRIGRPRTLSAHFFHDYALDTRFPASWRLRKAASGGGSVADIGSHVFDLSRLLVGDIDRVLCRSRTIVARRPDIETGVLTEVDVDDASDVLVEFASGVAGTIRTNWMAPGYKTDLAFEVQGDAGTLRFSWTRNQELQLYDATEPVMTQGFRTIVIGRDHPGAEAFWPTPGQGLGYVDGFTILVHDLLAGLAGGVAPTPSFLDGMRAAEVVAAAQRSAETSAWVDVDRMGLDG